MKAYKGFNKDMTCLGFQYEEGKEYETEEASLCNSGFHACENPLDCFSYYAPGESVYHEVELDDNGERQNEDTKVVGKKIKIGAEIDIKGIVKAAIDLVFASTKVTAGRYSHSVTAGDNSHSVTAGRYSNSVTAGDNSHSEVKAIGGVAASLGYGCKAKACVGSAICLVERGCWNGEGYPLFAIKAAVVDGEIIKADTWYKLENGEFVEVKNEES